jgi:hypothetical protein
VRDPLGKADGEELGVELGENGCTADGRRDPVEEG